MLRHTRRVLVCIGMLVMLTACTDVQIMTRLWQNRSQMLTPSQPEAPSRLRKEAEAGQPEAMAELADWYWQQERSADSLYWYTRCAELAYPECLFVLGQFYYHGQGVAVDTGLTFTLWDRAARAGWDAAFNDLAWLLATAPDPSLRDGERALELMQRLRAIRPLDAVEIDTLAAVYARLGDFQQAADIQQASLQKLLAEGQPDETVLRNIRARLKLYRQGQAYVQSN